MTTFNTPYEAILAIQRRVTSDGAKRSGTEATSVGSARPTHEISNLQFVIETPSNRHGLSNLPNFDIGLSAARLIWMTLGRNDLLSMKTFDAGVSRFSDDGETIPGSCFGSRMQTTKSETNPFSAVIRRLRENNNSRRAYVPVFFPDDSVKSSVDIPCAIGISFSVRDGVLCSTVLMRSNNSIILLPYNIFEFSVFQERVALALGLPVGEMCYFTLSMHAYLDQLETRAAPNYGLEADEYLFTGDFTPEDFSETVLSELSSQFETVVLGSKEGTSSNRTVSEKLGRMWESALGLAELKAKLILTG